jgi:hypothetical protein
MRVGTIAGLSLDIRFCVFFAYEIKLEDFGIPSTRLFWNRNNAGEIVLP